MSPRQTSARRRDRHVAARAMLAWALLFAVALVSGSAVFREVIARVREAGRHVGDGRVAAKARVFGAAYASSLEELRRRIPDEGAFLLADASGGVFQYLWVRYDLAPRRAIFLGEMVGTRRDFLVNGRPKDAPPFVVVARGGGAAAELVEVDRFFEGVAVFDPGREDAQIPCSLEMPEEGTRARGLLTVQGWCLESGGRPCAGVRFFLDGREREPANLERFPRPDVERAVPVLGPATRAGFRARFPFMPGEARERSLTVYLQTADGRYRRLGPRIFQWDP